MPPYAVTGHGTPCCPCEGGVGRCDMTEKIVMFMRGGGVCHACDMPHRRLPASDH
ncbi:hypothetical protein HMPREF9555_00733 [Selenomonas artemidis F0399]|uniref:Uncharacterized protein n=1 Tax=Selenomonas artemidis F0399 TaxID=749551 RepID=E7N182_9FIRM|nr:hypothetical protein HMPREF9555_00733 [Selenomonas artemidis F0399]